MKKSFSLAESSSKVLFATSMGDLLVFQNGFLYLLNFRHHKFEVIAKDLKFFFEDINEEDFLEEELEWNPYTKAKEKFGQPSYDECFGYQPILAAGGPEKVENLKKVKLIEHIDLITQFIGPI